MNNCINTFLILSLIVLTNGYLLNPTFDHGDVSWTAIGQGFTTKQHPVTASNSLFISPREAGRQTGATQIVQVGSNVPSVVSVSASSMSEYMAAGQGEYVLQVVVVDLEGRRTTSQAHFENSNQWNTNGVKQVVPSVGSVEISLILSNIGAVWFDDVTLSVEEFHVDDNGFKSVRSFEAMEDMTAMNANSARHEPPHPGHPEPPHPGHPEPPHPEPPIPEPPFPGEGGHAGPGPAGTGPVAPKPVSTKPATATPTTKPAPVAATSAPSYPPGTFPPAAAGTYNLGLKYAIIAESSSDIRLGVVQLTFDSVGSQYDIIYPPLINGSLGLSNTDGSGKYLGIVKCTDTVGASLSQLVEIENYQITYGVKVVVFYSIPNWSSEDGVAIAPKGANALNATLGFASAASPYISGYNPSASFTFDFIWNYPAVITNTANSTSAMTITYLDGSQYSMAAFITNSTTGTKSLKFFCDQATWAPHSIGIGSFWLQWMSNNMYLGLRRVFMNLQCDDLFLASNVWDTVYLNSSDWVSYRITGKELLECANYMNATNKALLQLGSGASYTSNITVSWPFNGQGIIDNGGYKHDDLYLMAKQLIWSFVWEQHTYTHPELDNLTYAETKLELTQNLQETTWDLFGSYNHPRYSNTSMVTPSISGIFNGNALKALWDVGIRHIVGDNSRPELSPPFWYHGWYTNVTSNGFAGMHVVPREATYIYYDCNDNVELESEYNHLYRNYYGYDSTLADIVSREGVRVTMLLLSFRNDPYMFHQSNWRQFDYFGKNTTLVEQWLNAVLTEYTKYMTLPLHGHNHQLLSQKFVNREQRDACGFTGYVTVNAATRSIVSVGGSSTGSCDIAITGAVAGTNNNAATAAKLSVDLYGPDHTTWVNMRKDSFKFDLQTPISLSS